MSPSVLIKLVLIRTILKIDSRVPFRIPREKTIKQEGVKMTTNLNTG